MREAGMHLRRLANLWILLLVAAGLLLAPVAPAFARMMPDASAAAMQAMSDHAMSGQAMSHQAVSVETMSGQEMADDMPCCPDQSKSKGCGDCPFLALCMLSVSLPVPAGTASLVEREPLRSRIAARDDRLLDGLGAKPPDHPPRTHV
ncbi:hypothetical protein DXU07_35090 [Bradyrhizobium elkanii]|nr:hypothetical protein [Bradyrhizobium elkanii]NWL70490.1 hypothetical protein [Bradyrhizobium elkanii]QOZ18419.1 hypothetical protein XI02_27825 [Bradyrhizobium sp. CCBAU 21365]RYM20324.1 hypothetical protein EWH13_32200 [Bradyrhizobium elkanii]UQD85572.1 hypothetical protein JEY66_19020 [Bradyrhizobium elkanii USDA 76]